MHLVSNLSLLSVQEGEAESGLGAMGIPGRLHKEFSVLIIFVCPLGGELPQQFHSYRGTADTQGLVPLPV